MSLKKTIERHELQYKGFLLIAAWIIYAIATCFVSYFVKDMETVSATGCGGILGLAILSYYLFDGDSVSEEVLLFKKKIITIVLFFAWTAYLGAIISVALFTNDTETKTAVVCGGALALGCLTYNILVD